MGAWHYVAPRLQALLNGRVPLRYAGRPEFASPAEGSQRAHAAEQARIIKTAVYGAAENQFQTSGVNHAR